jgi:ZIP family zinc transporter
VAICIHNFPEGLATFVAALSDPALGVALCVTIAIHNIPEGFVVALPIYHATNNKWKALAWAFFSGISELVGALLGYLVLKDTFGPLAYGIVFGLVAGMMVFICIKELIPTALYYDKKDKYVSLFIVTGMAIMALSLVLFATI